MKRYLHATCIAACFFACQQPEQKQTTAANDPTRFALYSEVIKDSFYISVRLPTNYAGDSTRYPVVYVTDANLYFDPLAAIANSYAPVGLLPEAIIVGIGYKDLATMDSLRNRDYTYPEALPEYEMTVSGKAGAFLSFIRHQLSPLVDKRYSTDTTARCLFGHSLGGYFTLYALHQQLLNGDNSFHSFIAASPSLHYNNFYLPAAVKKLASVKRDLDLFVAYGGMEDEAEAGEPGMIPVRQQAEQLSALLSSKSRVNAAVYSGLGHMDMPLPVFVKGMNWCLNKE